MVTTSSPGALLEQVRAGSPRAVGRLISLVENGSPLLPELMAELAPSTGAAQVLGLTGAPGVGKSTTTSALVAAFRARGQRVGVLAVDPSSPFTGGALLGDRVRMQEHALDREVFLRSMATRGALGGLAAAVPAALRVLDAAGCERIIVETVGVGQSEVAIAGAADATLVLLAPGAGDAVQAAKAGVLEIADLFVINKASREGASALRRELRAMVALGQRAAGAWKPPVLSVEALDGEGIEELVAEVDTFVGHQRAGAEWDQRRTGRAATEIEQLALAQLRRGDRAVGGSDLGRLAADVAAGRLDPYAAADQLLQTR